MATAQSTNTALSGRKLIEYPIGIARSDKDEYGRDKQFVQFKIITDKKASKLNDETGSRPVYISDEVIGTGRSGQNINTKSMDPAYRDRSGDSAVQWRVQPGLVELDKVIILPMPNDHSVNTAIRYNTDYQSSLLTQAADTLNQNAGGVMLDGLKVAGAFAGAGAINALKASITKAGGDVTSTNAILAANRIAMNPKKEVMFEGFGYRQFTFSYFFAPKNKKESDMVNEIIKTFRYYSLPELAPSKLFYTFPSEFELEFMLGSVVNPNIPKITRSVLQRVGVNYSPAGTGWVTLPNGSPVALQMTLEFIEIELVDRGRVWTKDKASTSGY